MAEHPGTPHTPDPADDDLSPAAFDGLGLGSLSDDVRPSRSQWTAIEAAVARRGPGRRPWLISAAAAVVLIVAVAGLLAARSGPPRVAVGNGGPGGLAIDDLPVHVIPTFPYDIQTVTVQSNGATMSYEADGAVVTFGQYSANRTDSGGPRTSEELAALALQEQARHVDAGRQGLVWVWCEQNTVGQDGEGKEIDTGAAADARWISDGVSYILAAVYGPTTCEDAITQITARATALRQVTRGEWQLFLDNHSAVTVPAGPLATTAPTTTTLPEDPPADRSAAEEQIRVAVAAWNRTDAAGSFPNLEAGTEKAVEYAEMFDTAAEQSGAARSEDRTGNTNSVTSIRFVTPERASIVMSLTAELPTGTYTFPQDGEAILQAGRWVVTYRTVTSTLRRACTPPGGYDGCPDDGNGTPIAVPAN